MWIVINFNAAELNQYIGTFKSDTYIAPEFRNFLAP